MKTRMVKEAAAEFYAPFYDTEHGPLVLCILNNRCSFKKTHWYQWDSTRDKGTNVPFPCTSQELWNLGLTISSICKCYKFLQTMYSLNLILTF